MRVTIHRGTHEIGGSNIELTSGSTRIILDAGLPLVTPEREPFDQKALRRKSTQELIDDGTIPSIPGLFTDGNAPDGILLTHSHLDHSGLLHLSNPAVPIYASSGTSKMMLAGAVFSRQQSLDRARFRKVVPGELFPMGELKVTPFAVDHSAFGSLAYLIESPEKTLLYSGDLRAHGRKPGMARTLIESVADKNIDVLLMEGTHFGSGRSSGISEFDLEEEIVQKVRAATGLVLACFSPIDVDRLVTYYRSAQRSGRVLVADAYTAFVLHLAAGEISIPRPVATSGIRVFFNRAFESRRITALQERFSGDRIDLAEILGSPSKHLMVFRPSMRELDFGGTLPEHCLCLYSYWPGYLDRADWVELKDHLKSRSSDFCPVLASGHIYIDDLVRFVKSVNPKTVIPIHTFEPNEFQRHFENVVVLNDRQEYLV